MDAAAGKTVKALALFDFDGTMLRGDSIVAYVGFARKKRILSLFGYVRTWLPAFLYLLKKITAEESKTRALSFRMEMNEQEREALDRSFVRENLLPRLYPQAKDRLEKHRKEGKKLVLVTASTENYMRFVADALGFDGLLASPMDEAGRVYDNCRGEEKTKRIHDWLKENRIQADFASSWAYGDSKSDLPMLRLAGHPVQVNPKKKLRKAAPDMEAISWG